MKLTKNRIAMRTDAITAIAKEMRKMKLTKGAKTVHQLTREGEMKFNEKQRKEFEEAARPLMSFLRGNCHPHVTVIVDYSRASVLEGVVTFVTEDYVKD